MDHDRRKSIEQLCKEALCLRPVERSAFLAKACKGDEELRREVEARLSAGATEIMEQPAVEIAAKSAGPDRSRLAAGHRLNQYSVLSMLGAGAMGEVYRAHDTKLKRDVAIKILPEEFSVDPDRVRRFQREAEVLASLNHPNIAAIYDLEESIRTPFLVLELVEGETLAERIQRGPVPVDEALQIANHICGALEAAHEKGIIHRDLKPANIKITPEGKVKLLDFGLAKALELSPFVVDPAVNFSAISAGSTKVGMVVGTAAYMSPEQARGKLVDRRTDIWAFGCVLYEMLTGQRCFQGENGAEVMLSIVSKEPDWALLPPGSPVNMLRKCLEKDPARRLRDIGDAFHLEEVSSATLLQLREASLPAAATSLYRYGAIVAAAAILALLVSSAVRYFRAPSVETGTIQFSISPPKSRFAVPPDLPEMAVSPDGTMMVFITEDDHRKMWLRRFDSAISQPVEGADEAHRPFWSPDSKYIGFWTEGNLYKVPINGGSRQFIAGVHGIPRVLWRGEKLFLNGRDELESVPVNGGPSARLGFTDCNVSDILPDNKHVLCSDNTDIAHQGVWVATIDGKERKQLLKVLSNAVYAEPGYLITAQDKKLLAYPFDSSRLEIRGDAQVIADNVAQAGASASISVSNNGVLAYATGTPNGTEIAWFDRSGNRLSTVGPPDYFRQFRMSPDSRQLVLDRTDPKTGDQDIWVGNLSSQVFSRLTSDPSADVDPVFSPDGREVAFGSHRNHKWQVFRKKIGTDLEAPFADGKPKDWSKTGNLLLYRSEEGGIYSLSMSDESKPTFIAKDLRADEFILSPDATWVAFNSFPQAGGIEVGIARFPSLTDWRQLSNDGGGMPRWRADGRELFYMSSDGKLMSVPVRLNGKVETGTPRALFDTGLHPNLSLDLYAATADGQKFLVLRPVERVSSPIAVITNWSKLIH